MNPIFETIDCCRICDNYNLVEILNLGEQPPANSLNEVGARKPHNVPLRLMYCKNCSTVQLGEDVDPEYLFGKYLWVTGTSGTTLKYSEKFTKKALENTNNKTPFVVEVASNDGTLLKSYKLAGMNYIGIDPTISRFKNFYPKNFKTKSGERSRFCKCTCGAKTAAGRRKIW